MGERTVYITLANGTPRTGIWCRTCQLPSAIEVDIWWLRSDGPHHLGTGRTCPQCRPSDTGEQATTGQDDDHA